MSFENLSEELQKLLEKAEEMDWSYEVEVSSAQNEDSYVDLETYSPAGEDFIMTIFFDKSNQVETFLTNLRDYADNFDVDEHVENLLPIRGQGGCPSSLEELLKDARKIKKMIEELSNALKLEHQKEDVVEKLKSEQYGKLKELHEKLDDVLDCEPADSGDEAENEILKQAKTLKSLMDNFFR